MRIITISIIIRNLQPTAPYCGPLWQNSWNFTVHNGQYEFTWAQKIHDEIGIKFGVLMDNHDSVPYLIFY